MPTFTTTIYGTTSHPVGAMDWEAEVVVTYAIRKGTRARRIGMDRFAEPDDPDELEILSIVDSDGEEVYLTEAQEERIEEQIWDAQE